MSDDLEKNDPVLEDMTDSAKRLLCTASFLGHRFFTEHLAVAENLPSKDIYNILWPAIQSKVIIPEIQTDEKNPTPKDFIKDSPHIRHGSYRFAKKEFRFFFHRLSDHRKNKSIHLTIGRKLIAGISPNTLSDNIFQIVKHMNLGQDFIINPTERIMLSELNLNAGRRMKNRFLFKKARYFLSVARGMLHQDAWETHRELAFEIYMESIFCEFVTSNKTGFKQLLSVASEKCVTDLETCQLYLIEMSALSFKGNDKKAISLGIKALQKMNVFLPDPFDSEAISLYHTHQKSRFDMQPSLPSSDHLETAMINKSPEENMVTGILSMLLDYVILEIPEYLKVITLTMINRSRQKGYTRMSPLGYAYQSAVLASQEDYESAYQFSEFAEKLNAKAKKNDHTSSRLPHILGNFISHPAAQGSDTIPHFKKKVMETLTSGDCFSTWIDASNFLKEEFFSGIPLDIIFKDLLEIERYLKPHKGHFKTALIIEIFKAFILSLKGETQTLGSFDHNDFNEEDFRKQYKDIPVLMANLDAYKLMAFYLLGLESQAISIFEKSNLTVLSYYPERDHLLFFKILILICQHKKAPQKEHNKIEKEIENWSRAIKKWVRSYPKDISAYELLISAEKERIFENDIQAIRLYNEAIKAAEKNRLVLVESLSNELAGKFWQRKGEHAFANTYLSKALLCYKNWHADALVKNIEQTFPFISSLSIIPGHDESPPGRLPEPFDLKSFMNATRRLSRQTEPDKLLATTMIIISELTGSEKTVSVTYKENGNLYIDAMTTDNGDVIHVKPAIPVENYPHLLKSSIQEVINKNERILLHNPTKESTFENAPCISTLLPKSVLILPVKNNGVPTGVLYLENYLFPNAFDETHVEISEYLLMHATASMEIARTRQSQETLIHSLKEKEKRESQVRKARKIEAIGTLAGGIAHDFNNILGIIIGNVELAQDDIPESHAVHLNLEEIKSASLRAKNVVRQLLSVSKVPETFKKSTRLDRVIEEASTLLRASIPENIALRKIISEDIEPVNASAAQISQLIINLCMNSVQAIDNNNGSIDIHLANREFTEKVSYPYFDLPAGKYVELSIKDTGYGIHPDIRERIFDPYFTTRDVDKGSGLGLSVVHGIVHAHNGEILVDSEYGKGTTVRIFFPKYSED
ncbi:MAG: hypothetical protein KJ737_03330 [Proteobacteria bacterium]|nr:hypothetical protein [Pseudomonadota bacterium]